MFNLLHISNTGVYCRIVIIAKHFRRLTRNEVNIKYFEYSNEREIEGKSLQISPKKSTTTYLSIVTTIIL